MKDLLHIRGIITAVLRGPDGQIKAYERTHNIITNAGRQALIDRLQGGSASVWDYLAIGTDSTAAAAGNTTLGAEVARAQGTLSQPDAHTDRLVYNFPAGTGTGTIIEVGRFDSAADGVMLGRGILDEPKIKGALDSLEITYDFTYEAE